MPIPISSGIPSSRWSANALPRTSARSVATMASSAINQSNRLTLTGIARGRPARGPGRMRARGERSMSAETLPPRWRAPRPTARPCHTATLPRHRSPSFPDPYSRPGRGLPVRSTSRIGSRSSHRGERKHSRGPQMDKRSRCGARKKGRQFQLARAQSFQRDPRITLQKLPRWKCGSLSASTSALTLPNVVSGLCLMPSWNVWMMSSLKRGSRG